MSTGVVATARANRDRVAGFGLLGIGALAALAGSLQVSGIAEVRSQVAYLISGGLTGLILVGLGAALLVTADLGDAWRKIESLETRLPAADVARHDASAADQRAITPARVLTVAVGVAVAVLFVFASWWQASGAETSIDSFRAGGMGAAAVAIASLVVGFNFVSMRRRVEGRLRHLLARLAASAAQPLLASDGPSVRPAPQEPHGSGFVVGDGLTRFHRPNCPALRDVKARSVARHQVPGNLRPCQLCEAT